MQYFGTVSKMTGNDLCLHKAKHSILTMVMLPQRLMLKEVEGIVAELTFRTTTITQVTTHTHTHTLRHTHGHTDVSFSITGPSEVQSQEILR